VLTHTRLTDPAGIPDFGAGWHFHLDTLAAVAVGAEPPADRTTWEELRVRYAQAV
jgi:hypothetical protein